MDILFITSTRIGDAVLSSALLDDLAQTHKAARITVACGALAAPLFEAAPGVVRVIAIKKRPFAGHWLRLWADVALRSWDLVIDLRASAIAWTLFAGQRFVFRTNHVPGHRVEQLAALMDIVPTPAPRIHPSVAARSRAKELIPDGEPVLAIGPTANWVGKQWPNERFVEVVRHLTAPGGAMPNARVAVLGAGSERDMAQPLLDSIPEGRLIDLVGEVDISTAAACLERCALYLGNDSGLMHLAGAVGIPVVGLFGPSREAHYAPWGETSVVVRGAQSYDQIAAQPGFDLSGSDSYMDGLEVAPVIAAAETLLGKASMTGEQI